MLAFLDFQKTTVSLQELSKFYEKNTFQFQLEKCSLSKPNRQKVFSKKFQPALYITYWLSHIRSQPTTAILGLNTKMDAPFPVRLPYDRMSSVRVRRSITSPPHTCFHPPPTPFYMPVFRAEELNFKMPSVLQFSCIWREYWDLHALLNSSASVAFDWWEGFGRRTLSKEYPNWLLTRKTKVKLPVRSEIMMKKLCNLQELHDIY